MEFVQWDPIAALLSPCGLGPCQPVDEMEVQLWEVPPEYPVAPANATLYLPGGCPGIAQSIFGSPHPLFVVAPGFFWLDSFGCAGDRPAGDQGWAAQPRSDGGYGYLGHALASRGIAVLALDSRIENSLADEEDRQQLRAMSMLLGTAEVLGNPSFSLDPERVAVGGHSNGGVGAIYVTMFNRVMSLFGLGWGIKSFVSLDTYFAGLNLPSSLTPVNLGEVDVLQLTSTCGMFGQSADLLT